MSKILKKDKTYKYAKEFTEEELADMYKIRVPTMWESKVIDACGALTPEHLDRLIALGTDLTCGMCSEPCGNSWCCMKEEK